MIQLVLVTVISIILLVPLLLLTRSILNWRSTRYLYKPSKADIKIIIDQTIDGTLKSNVFDYFLSVEIGYDKKLEGIRQLYMEIVHRKENNQLVDGKFVPYITALNAAGKEQLKALLVDLEKI